MQSLLMPVLYVSAKRNLAFIRSVLQDVTILMSRCMKPGEKSFLEMVSSPLWNYVEF